MRMSSRTGNASNELPGIDERLVAPETDYEIEDGKLVRVSPSKEPHAVRHSKISALLEAYVADGFEVASDMLTRVSETSDRAPDASVYPKARDPVTGGRQLEQLAFEVVSTETLTDAGKKAAQFAARGVRRVFAIDVGRERAFEWSTELGTWSLLDPGGAIDDPCLAIPLPLDDLVRAARADDAMARALLAKRNPVLVAAIAEGEARGEARGKERGEARGRAESVVLVLARRGLVVTAAERERILAEHDLARLDGWLTRALTCTTTAALFE